MEIKQMLTQKRCYIGQNRPYWIVIHETDNPARGAGARQHARAMANGNLDGTVHYYVDDSEIYQTLRHSDGGYSIGRNYGYSAVGGRANNKNVLSVEICVNPDSDYERARLNAVWLVKKLLKEYGWGVDRVIRHYDAKGKYCPRRMMDQPELWEDFKKRLTETEEINMEELQRLREDFEKEKAAKNAVINQMGKELAELKGQEMIYNYIDDNMPQWAREPVGWFVSKGIIKGEADGLGLTYKELRLYTVMYRAVRFVCRLMKVEI